MRLSNGALADTPLQLNMAYSPTPSQGHHHVRLWSSVECLLQNICGERAIDPPGEAARGALAALQDEKAAIDVLAKIRTSASPIRSLSGYIIYMTRKAAGPPPALAGESRENNAPALTPHPIANGPRCRAVLNMEVPRDTEEGSLMEVVTDTVMTPQLQALGEMEFRKAFLVLSYIGREKLDNVPLRLLERLKPLPMAQCESELWDAFGKDWILPTERRKNLDWDSSKTHVYHCHVNVDGNIKFKGPYLQNGRTHLQKVLGDDNVLLVKFAEEDIGDKSCHKFDMSRVVYQQIAQEGIVVGLRRYRFFVFKDGGKEEKKKDPMSSALKCYFVRMESNWAMDNESYVLSDKFVHEARAVFMHIHTIPNLSKYMIRFSLILSKTTKLDVDLASVHIEDIEDIPCTDDDGGIVCDEHGKPMIHTDGTGFISEDLALKCPRNVVKGNCKIPADVQRFLEESEALEGASNHRQYKSPASDAALLIQFRMYNNGRAVKGTLLLNKQLPPNTICIRPSMIKVREDPNLTYIETSNSLEIVTTSNQPKRTYLSRYLISLLHYGGVPEEFFLELLTNALADATNVKKNKKTAFRVAVRYGDMDDYLVARMILCGIPLDEPYLQYRLSILIREEQKSLKAGRLPVTECYYLMGTADPTNTLKANEVCIILENGQISGDVLVYKHPGLHFGDIHKLAATYIKDLEKFVGNSKYAIFFPTKGARSLADEMANSDFDGDMYWVSRNPQLLRSFNSSMPWVRKSEGSFQPRPMETSLMPMEIPCEELEKELFKQFLINRFKPSRAVSVAADCWLVFMDRLLTSDDNCVQGKENLIQKILKLVDIYYDALDAPKTGLKVDVPYELQVDKYPHFMERTNSYNSKSILGLIYDKSNSFKMRDDVTSDGSVEIRKLPCFKDITPSLAANMLWTARYRDYREEMRCVMECHEPKESRDATADRIIQKYKQMLYGAEDFENSCRRRDEIFDEALAIYQITYDYAQGRAVGRCSFAWNVAGRALCMLHAFKQDQERSIICLPSVLEEIFN